MALILAVIAVVVAGLLGDGQAPPGTVTMRPTVETDPVPSRGDAADDPAIWTHPRRPRRSTVIGTDKDGGIAVYDLAGRELQYRQDGDINNVDLRERFPLAGRRVTLVAATNRSRQAVSLYTVGPISRRLRLLDPVAATPDLGVNGICMYRGSGDRAFYFFVTGLQGEVEQWRVRSNRHGRIGAERVRRFKLESSAEACVADDARGRLYVAEETRGIWSFGAKPGAGRGRRLVEGTDDDGSLVADVEGLAIAGAGDTGELIASSQGSNSYAVYELARGNDYRGSFRMEAGRRIDGAEETDGIEVTASRLGPGFRHGLFAAQDDDNGDENQNFKLMPRCSPRSVLCPGE
jgi:3-phytase